MRRAREIMAIDPTAENALDLVGTVALMTCRFSVHYETKLGEDLFVIGSHEKLGAWNINATPAMVCDGGRRVAGRGRTARGRRVLLQVRLRKADGGYRWQDGANNLLALPVLGTSRATRRLWWTTSSAGSPRKRRTSSR